MNLTHLNIGEFEHRLLLAFALGTVIGMERQWRHKIAGVKTNALVAGGAALFILLSQKITGDPSGAARIAANIVTGIGFLGAGVMMRNGLNVTGINTAATIWCSSAIGALAGLGYWYESIVGTAFVVFGNILLRPIGEKIDQRITQIKESGHAYTLQINVSTAALNDVKLALTNNIAESKTLHIRALLVEGEHLIEAHIEALDKRQTDLEQVANMLRQIEGVKSIKWEEQVPLHRNGN